jgi:hypothetical protein
MTIKQKIRDLGYKLAVRELYGENTPSYFNLKREHDKMLRKLYELEKRSL